MSVNNVRNEIARSQKTKVGSTSAFTLTEAEFLAGVVTGGTIAQITITLPTPKMSMVNRECAFLAHETGGLLVQVGATAHGFGTGGTTTSNVLTVTKGCEARIALRDTNNAGNLRYFVASNPTAPA